MYEIYTPLTIVVSHKVLSIAAYRILFFEEENSNTFISNDSSEKYIYINRWVAFFT